VKNTKSAYEKYLNELYTDMYTESEAYDQFCYLKNGKIKKSKIYTAHANHKLGTLVRKYDPFSFNVYFKIWAGNNLVNT